MKIKTLIVSLTVAFTCGAFAMTHAQSGGGGGGGASSRPSKILMKKDQVVSNNVARVAHVQVSAYASSMLYSSTTRSDFQADYNPAGQPKMNEVLALLGSQPLVYNLAKPSVDWVSLNAWYYNANWEFLFSGGTSFQLEQNGSGGWRTPAGAGVIELHPAEVVYEVSDLSGVRFIERDDNGNQVNWYYVDVDVREGERNSFRLPDYLLDKKGELYLQTFDPETWETNTYAYDSETGSQIVPSAITSVASGKFYAMQKVVPQLGSIMGRPFESNKGYGQTEVLEVEVTTNGVYSVSQVTTEGELPDSVIVWFVGDATESEYDRIDPAQNFVVSLKKGVYHLRFTWPKFRPYESPIPGNGGGGGGKGIMVAP